MKWFAIAFGVSIVAIASGCWRPYYGQTYAPPAYQQAPAYQGAPVYQPGQVVQPVQQAPVVQQAPIVQQGYSQQMVCPQVCTPCY